MKIPLPLLFFSQSDYVIKVVHTNTIFNDKQCRSRSVQKPTDLDLHCLQRGQKGFSKCPGPAFHTRLMSAQPNESTKEDYVVHPESPFPDALRPKTRWILDYPQSVLRRHDQSVRMCRLIRVLTGCTCTHVGNVLRRLPSS